MSRASEFGKPPVKVYALLTREGRIRGGDSRPYVFWTKSQAKRYRELYPDCTIEELQIVELGEGDGER